MKKKLVALSVLTSILAMPSVLAASSVADGLTSFVNGFRQLFATGDVGALVAGILGAVPLIGLFFIVFGLMFYLSKITIFRSDNTDKYARWVAIGIALIGIVQQGVYNTILGLSTTFLILTFILAIVFMFIVFLNKSREGHYVTAKEMRTAQGQYYGAKGEAIGAKRKLTQMEHEFRLDTKYYKKVNRDLDSLDHDLQHMKKLSGSELAQVDKLAELLRKANVAAQNNDQTTMHAYIQTLTRDVGSLITTMKHDGKDVDYAQQVLERLHLHSSLMLKEAKEEKTAEEHLRRILHALLLKSHAAHATSHTTIIDKVMQENKGIVRHLGDIRASEVHILGLEKAIERHMEHLNMYGYGAKHASASACRDYLMQLDLASAHKELDHLRSLIEHGAHQSADILNLERDIRSHLSRIDSTHRIIETLLHDIVSKITTPTP